MVRQIGNIFDIVSAICSRSNRALGCVRQHRVHALAMPLGMWRRIRLLTAYQSMSFPVPLPSCYMAWYWRLHFSYCHP